MGQTVRLIANRKRYDTATATRVHRVDGPPIEGTAEPSTTVILCRGQALVNEWFLWERAGQAVGGENGPQSITPLTVDQAIAWGVENMPAAKFTATFGPLIVDV